MNSHLAILPAATRLQDLPSNGNEVIVVTDASGVVVGAVTGENLTALVHPNPTGVIGDVVKRNYLVVPPDDSVWEVVAAMRSTDSAFALVASHDGDLSAVSVQGIITRKAIMDALAGDMEVFGI